MNLFEQDTPLREALAREGGGWNESEAAAYGALLGRAETLRLGELANRYPPVLQTHDRFGHRLDRVEYHSAYHDLMRLGIDAGAHSRPWAEPRPGAHVARAVMMMLHHQVDEGTSCPITMTFAAIPALRRQPNLAAEWEPRILANHYDPRPLPARAKRGVLVGMAMTERQGGSDVQANTTRARPLGPGGPGTEYEITGHKWFCSAPNCDAFLVLAQAPRGLACFLLPRWMPDGSPNGFRISRLKDKLGNRSNASSEVEFHGARAQMVGEEGRGLSNIIEMVRHTRLDCVLGSAATLRRAVAEATHHAHYRQAFGGTLESQPLMKNVLADLCLESEAATALALRLARGFDRSPLDEQEEQITRVATPIAKYWVTRRAVQGVAEALECLGGNGYVEEGPLARLYRDVPVNSIWEGSGNIQCLDVLRAVRREPQTLDALLAELESARGADRQYDNFLEELKDEIAVREAWEARARCIVEQLALALQASILLRAGNSIVASPFCASRLGPTRRLAFGVLPPQTAFDAILERSRPAL